MLQGMWPRRVIFDPMDEYPVGRKYPGRTAARTFDEFTAELARLDREEPKAFELVVKIDLEKDEEQVELEFDEALKLLYDFGNLLIVVEEVQMFSHSHSIPHRLRNCLLTGRHKGLGLMFTSQRPGEVHKTIFAMCAHVFIGQTSEGNDLRYLTNMIGDAAKRLPAFKPRRFLYYGPHGISEISTEGENSDLSKALKSRAK